MGTIAASACIAGQSKSSVTRVPVVRVSSLLRQDAMGCWLMRAAISSGESPLSRGHGCRIKTAVVEHGLAHGGLLRHWASCIKRLALEVENTDFWKGNGG